MSIVTGEAIKDYVSAGLIHIDPFNPRNVQPNSVDLTLGDDVRIYKQQVGRFGPGGLTSFEYSRSFKPLDPCFVLDTKCENLTESHRIDETGWVVKPGILYLMHTHEVVGSNKFVTQLNGKSSIARLGVIIHFTAGYGDIGFKGQYTLEVSGIHPVVLYAGMKICQAVFYSTEGERTQYAGNYVGETARGAQPSRSWQQFKQ